MKKVIFFAISFVLCACVSLHAQTIKEKLQVMENEVNSHSQQKITFIYREYPDPNEVQINNDKPEMIEIEFSWLKSFTNELKAEKADLEKWLASKGLVYSKKVGFILDDDIGRYTAGIKIKTNELRLTFISD